MDKKTETLSNDILLKAYRLMMTAKAMAETYEANRQICKYVHSTSRGHEAIQLATGFLLQSCDYVSPYYRDESLMLGMGYRPYELMLQLLAKVFERQGVIDLADDQYVQAVFTDLKVEKTLKEAYAERLKAESEKTQ